MRVLSVTDHAYLPQFKGGSETVIQDLTTRLQRDGHVSAVMSSLQPDGALRLCNRLAAKIGGQSFPVDWIMGYPTYRGWDVMAGTNEVIKRFRPDVAVVHAGFQQAALVYSLLNSGTPTIVYLHDVNFGPFDMEQNLKLVANSRFTAQRFKEIFGKECPVVPPIMNFDRYECNKRSPKFLTMINPVRMKGVETTLALAEHRPDIPILLVESWHLQKDYRDELAARCHKLPNVRLVRSVLDMRHIYGQTKILLAPSVWEECWGRVVTEAQVSGIPVVASQIGGLPEAVGSGGILVPPEAPIDAWIDAVAGLWDDDCRYREASAASLAQSQKARADMSKGFDLFFRCLQSAVRENKAVEAH